MTEPRLTPTSYVVLGLVASAGRSTPYDLKRLAGETVGFFWSFPHSQLYAEPARLAEAGLLREERERTGRNRRHYTITREGRAALREWIGAPTTSLPEVRDLGLLKLIFAEQASEDDLFALASAQRDAHRTRLERYAALESQLADLPGAGLSVPPIELGLEFERVCVEFWQKVRRKAARRRTRG